jgi:predicted NBD/HSP70 family sugar kinase
MNMIMTENEKRILTVLSQQGSLSKKVLVEQGGMAWATVVKMLDRLEDAGLVECVGTDSHPETTGKNPLLYGLSERHPLALGIDVSYSTTQLILTNLRHDILAQQSCPTPAASDVAVFQEFLIACCMKFLEHALAAQEQIAGIGLGCPLWLLHGQEGLTCLQQGLEQHFQIPVRIDNNVRSYAMYKKWAGKAFALDDFLLLTIRSGIGTGIFQSGQLVRGAHGLAGEVSHLPVQTNGKPCRCGKTGCLETVVNQDILYQSYVMQILQPAETASMPPTDTAVKEGLAILFSLAKQGHHEAVKIVRQTALYLGNAIATLLLLFDIPRVFIVANFGPDGEILLPWLQEIIDSRTLAGSMYTLTYTPLEHLGFAHGAALLILNDYLTAL